ncbi:MAG: hypothetical protein SOZ39_10355 [Desulfovibrio piger]|uniref:hypothetical protein n=1 Tax=Desulfovibrio piger TaxID=901 RepID=UPI002A7F909C|nr:hypothetical protein [Desulfovibrio piger]MDY3881520.1 hypothetical protein [Desulfovibrio piger]
MMRRPVRFLWLVCLMVLAFGLCACQEENASRATLDKKTASAVVTKAAAGLLPAEAPAPAEEVEAAGKVLDAGNAVWRWADVAGIHAGHLLRQAEDYMRTWLLGKEPQRPAELDDRPAVEKAVWGEADAARLRDLMATMRRTLTGMEKLVTAFRKYALDESIVDDGAQGKKLLRRLKDAHAEFSKARDALLVLVRDRSRQAEDVLLQGNPLKEAISSARFLFSRFLLGGILLREGNPDTVAVAGWRKEMEDALAAARGHTRGMTEEERRLWQAFLDKADLFPRTVAQGQEDAFSNATRRQLNLVLQEAQEAYNAFVEAHNRRDAASR